MFVMLSISPFVSSSSSSPDDMPSTNQSNRPPSKASMSDYHFPFLADRGLVPPIGSFITIAGESIITFWKSNGQNAYIAILFYASWCPFSMDVQPKFAALSSMYPQIHHVMIEHSSSILSLAFFIHRVRGVPKIALVNMTTNVEHHGAKDLNSLLQFYQQSTGLDPVLYLTEDQINSFKSRTTVGRSWNRRSWKDMAVDEPYLAFSVLFVSLKILSSLAPWVRYIPRLILAILGKSREILVDLKKAFSKPKLWKNRNLHKQQNMFRPFFAKSRDR
ncbi:hypothetical protein OSB04_009974 [Centaurea solstitialis]|uniref:Thioredoxin domain-containing protein n=1 Tax=Centaurea solstitialis TaxID=347529 RepID=A0AA38T6M5_9ASTR|nr:hypothetical protein OSB04_009974 [Centaurea solstitialis]